MVVEAAEKKYDLYWKDPAKKGFWSQLQTEHYITTSFNCNRLLMKEDQTLHSSLWVGFLLANWDVAQDLGSVRFENVCSLVEPEETAHFELGGLQMRRDGNPVTVLRQKLMALLVVARSYWGRSWWTPLSSLTTSKGGQKSASAQKKMPKGGPSSQVEA